MQHPNGSMTRLKIVALALLVIAVALLAVPRVLGHEPLSGAADRSDSVESRG